MAPRDKFTAVVAALLEPKHGLAVSWRKSFCFGRDRILPDVYDYASC